MKQGILESGTVDLVDGSRKLAASEVISAYLGSTCYPVAYKTIRFMDFFGAAADAARTAINFKQRVEERERGWAECRVSWFTY